METQTLYFLVYMKKKKKYVLRDRQGQCYELTDKLSFKKIDFCDRGMNILYLKSKDALYHIDIQGNTDKQKELRKEIVDDIIFCMHGKTLTSFDGEMIKYLSHGTWKIIHVDEVMNDVYKLHSFEKLLLVFGTNYNEESCLLRMQLNEQKPTAKRIKIETEKTDKTQETEEDESDSKEDSLKIANSNMSKIENNAKVVAVQTFKNMLFFIFLTGKKKKEYMISCMMESISKVLLIEKTTQLLGFFVCKTDLYLYGKNEKGILLFYKYNQSENKFHVCEVHHPRFFKKNETNYSMFPIILTNNELLILTQGTFYEKRIRRRESFSSIQSLIITEKRNTNKPRPNYCEIKSDSDSSVNESSYDDDDIEYIEE